MQKSIFSSSDKFSDNTFIGIEEVFDETTEPTLRFLKIFSYKLCLISIFSTTASTIQSASFITLKSSLIFPTLILFIFVLSNNKGGLEL
jgi:hypothetical protein